MPLNHTSSYRIVYFMSWDRTSCYWIVRHSIGLYTLCHWIGRHSMGLHTSCHWIRRHFIGSDAGAGENTLRRLAHFLCLDHPTKSDVTSGKKATWAAKLNLNATSSFSLQLKYEDFVIGRMFLTFNSAIIPRILSSSSPYRLFEEQGNYLLKNTPFWRHVLSRNVVISSSLNSARVIVCVEIMNSR